MEKLIEKFIYASRWFLAPIYAGLSLAVLALGVVFFRELLHLLGQSSSIIEQDAVLVVLALIDISMVSGLLVMVMLSGYENFVSQLNIEKGAEKLGWLGKMDSSSLKAKIAASIVAISSIHLLKVFMNAPNVDNGKIFWYVVLHLTFVVSAFAMGMMDHYTRGTHGK